MREKNVPAVFGSWDGARFWDWWMVVHALAGAVGGYGLRLVGLSLSTSVIVTLIVLVAWEVYERLANINEPWVNTFIDIVIGMVGFFVAFLYFPSSTLSHDIILAVFLFLVWGGLSVWGWLAYLSRRKRKQ